MRVAGGDLRTLGGGCSRALLRKNWCLLTHCHTRISQRDLEIPKGGDLRWVEGHRRGQLAWLGAQQAARMLTNSTPQHHGYFPDLNRKGQISKLSLKCPDFFQRENSVCRTP